MKFSDDIVAEAIKKYYEEHDYMWAFSDECYLVATFYQKYAHQETWDHEAQLIIYNCKTDTIIYEDDFCEGQTEVKDINVYDLYDVLEYFKNNFKEEK